MNKLVNKLREGLAYMRQAILILEDSPMRKQAPITYRGLVTYSKEIELFLDTPPMERAEQEHEDRAMELLRTTHKFLTSFAAVMER